MNKKQFINILILFLKISSAVLFLYLIYKIGIEKIYNSLISIDFLPFAFAIITFALIFLLKSIRWKIICDSYSISINYWNALKLYYLGVFIGFITPGRIGEFSKAYYLTKDNISINAAISTVIIDRIIDLIILFILALISFIYFNYRFNILHFDFKAIIATIAFLVLICLVSFLLYKKFKSQKIVIKILSLLKVFVSLKLTTNQKIKILIFTVLSLVFGYLQFYWVAVNIGININLIDLSACSIIVSLVQLLPLSFFGIGTRDISLVFLFSLLNISSEYAISLSIITLVALIISIIPGLIMFLMNNQSKNISVISKQMQQEFPI